jgi:hypothetical protein
MPRGAKYGGKDFQKGNSFSKGYGRPKVPDDVKEARKMNANEFTRILNKYIGMTISDLIKTSKDPATTAFDLLVIKIVTEAVRHGNLSYFNCLVDRLIGKVAERHHHTGSMHAAIMSAIHQIEEKDDIRDV